MNPNFLHRLLVVGFAAALIALPAMAGNERIFKIQDPRGDDHGDGRLEYPIRTEYSKGDFDLLSLEARRGKGETRFVATFASPIKVAERRPVDDLGTSLETVARNGFYTFNIDIYIDQDRQAGSGWVGTLPGRKAEVSPEHAWEKAIVLTPSPNDARLALERMMIKTVNKELRSGVYEQEATAQTRQELRRTIPHDLARQVYFPTRARVRGNQVTFTVPDSFLGGSAEAEWSYVVVVSGADLLQRIDISAAFGLGGSDDENLMILPVSPGRWKDRFGGGREGEEIQPPLVDILVPKGVRQERILGSFSTYEKRPVQLTGVVPADELLGYLRPQPPATDQPDDDATGLR